MIEWLGSAPSGTEPACIVRWVVPPANKLKPPPRAKQVAARPEQPCLALQREADEQLRRTEESGLNSRPFAGQKLQRRQAPKTGAEEALQKHCLPTGGMACELERPANASRTKSGALAAKGRTARGRTALVPLAKRHSRRFKLPRRLASERIRFLRCLTFEITGMPRLAGACPLDWNAKGLPTFGQRRQSAKIGGVQSHQSQAYERGSPWRRLHEV